MAEIKIERKKKPVWPWLLLLLIIALIAWALYEFTNAPNESKAAEVPATGLVRPVLPPAHLISHASV
jgi:hypothetical protein